ncbi:MAG: hypothetical protein KGR26_04540 [Cyanobacteria bacterium REEB65]|nr:hypothetical protein [Cyanobacteria bacterium REEB65]
MTRPTCGSCPHYVTNPLAVGEGVCHFNPPIASLVITPKGPISVPARPGVSSNEVGCHHHPQIGEKPVVVNGFAGLTR